MKTGDSLDVRVLDRLIDHVGAGVDALLLGDLFWGEALALSLETRVELACTALEIVQGKWPVLITITAGNMKATRDLLSRIEDFVERSGYTGKLFWVDYPIYYHSNRGLPQWYESMARDTGISLILANDAGLVEGRKRAIKHKNIRTRVLKKVSQIEKIGGLIFRGSLKRSMNYHKAVRHRRDFSFYDGDEVVFIRQPSSDGVVAGGANLLPQAWRQITWSCLNPYDVQQRPTDYTSQILEIGVMVEELYNCFSPNPPAILKRMLHVAGVLPNAHAASATQPSTAGQNRAVEALCKKFDLL
jgi:dihydrodipicolinate synthase/N-acetylneuraminate lyase